MQVGVIKEATPVELVHGEEGVYMVGMLLQQRHDVVWIKAGLALLKQHLNRLQIAAIFRHLLNLHAKLAVDVCVKTVFALLLHSFQQQQLTLSLVCGLNQ